jgi:hypothetical protein
MSGEAATNRQRTGFYRFRVVLINLRGTIDSLVGNTFDYPTLVAAPEIAGLDAWSRMGKCRRLSLACFLPGILRLSFLHSATLPDELANQTRVGSDPKG